MKIAIIQKATPIVAISYMLIAFVFPCYAAEQMSVTYFLDKVSDLLSTKLQITSCSSRIPFSSVGLRCNLALNDLNMTIETNNTNIINSVTIFQGTSSEAQFLNSACSVFRQLDANINCDITASFFQNMKQARFVPIESEIYSISGSWSRNGSFLAIKTK